LINIQFHKKVSIIEVAFYLDYKLDESYTPKKLSIRAGTTFHDLVEIHVMELSEPTGWVSVPLHTMDGETAQVRAIYSCATLTPFNLFLFRHSECCGHTSFKFA
jgi:anaphase-promoting complex subunit 10